MDFDKILVTDFDGTMTQHDFYSCAVRELLSPKDLEPWHAYTRGEITHFESLQQIFAKIRAPMAEMERVLQAMQFDSLAVDAVRRLNKHGWKVIVVSNGCGWYIHRFFQLYNLQLELHTNPGEYSPEQGLRMTLPTQSPFFCKELGISKRDVVQSALQKCSTVAFAGDGRPDLDPALMVPPELRFAREWLAAELTSQVQPFREFAKWSDISQKLCEAEV